MTLQAGTRLGPYEILSPLGAGGMGEVYRAQDTRLGREVAIKVLPSSFATDTDRLRRFEQEARAASALNHPNIVTLHDVGQHDGAPYVVTELLEGETLRLRLSSGTLSARKATEYAIQIAQGLAAAHEKSIVHRDLKPENLFVTDDGRVKILDFGLAKLVQPEPTGQAQTSIPTASQGTEPGVVMGTAGYMAPEQVKGLPADPRSDIFSFGATLYEMLSGRRAFRGDSTVETMSAILKEDPPDLSETNGNITPGLSRLVRHCLEKSPAQRFQSARDLAYDLENLSAVSSGHLQAIVPSRRWRHARIPLAAAALAAAVLVGWLVRGARQSAAAPSYEGVTFQRGFASGGRFTPDGQTIVYAASWAGQPLRIFETRVGSTESRPLGLPDGDLFAVSSTGELAIGIGRRNFELSGTLARVPLAGGAPRQILEDVEQADWSPDGKGLAIVRHGPGKELIEYPIGTPLYQTANSVSVMRFSPRGDAIALLEEDTNGFSSVTVVDLSGKKRTLTKGWPFAHGLAWRPDAREIWFSAAGQTGSNEEHLHAVTLSGQERLVRREVGQLIILDIARDGRVLLSSNDSSGGMVAVGPGESAERDLTWLDLSQPDGLSGDGGTLLFDEWGRGGGAIGAVYLRKLDGSDAIRLAEGSGLAISRDARWVLAANPETGLALLPTGPGKPRALGGKGLQFSFWGGSLDGETAGYFRGNEPGRPERLYRVDVSGAGGASPKPISPEGLSDRGLAISPDGKQIASVGPEHKILLYPVDGGTPRALPGAAPHELPVQFDKDGRSLYVWDRREVPARVQRITLDTGQRQLWKELAPSDRTGVFRISKIVMTSDARAYAYSFTRLLTTLYVASGLQ
jgi:dipeptidyl aminopeptidase/acylaminoacyl peptidase